MSAEDKRFVSGYLHSPAKTKEPFLSVALRGFAVSQIVGGLILCITFWPRGSSYSHVSAGGADYSLSLAWLMAGLLSGVLLWAASAALTSIRAIEENTRSLRVSLQISDDPTADDSVLPLSKKVEEDLRSQIRGDEAEEPDEELQEWRQKMKEKK